MGISPSFRGRVFEPVDIGAMSAAIEELCIILNLADNDNREKEFLAKRIIALSQSGGCDRGRLRDRILRELAQGSGGWPMQIVRAARSGAL
jgi:hypothetical protein